MQFSRRDLLLSSISTAAASALAGGRGSGAARPRARDLGLAPGVFPPGALNAITDVPGVRVGHVTLIDGDTIRTGVTAIVPHPGNVFQDKVSGGVFVGNAYGKLAGSTQVQELGTIETPVILTNTLSVGTGMLGAISWTLAQSGNEGVVSVNAVVGETNDSGLSDIRGMHVTREHVIRAIETAKSGPVAEGTVGAGTGTMCLGWKGGIGTSSRAVPKDFGDFVVGVLVQTNFGGVLTMGGAPVGKELGRYDFAPVRKGSCMIVVATDAPLTGRECQRLAARAVYGLARVGSSYENGSGDFAIAFSTAYDTVTTDSMSPLFQAALEATEEAVYNSLLQATTVHSLYRTAEAIPIDRVRAILKKYRAA
ncbi:MAG TPA: P1 family peptidase [Candidatus Baltobacteraceae bacterium]|nr:P1 family peptidase [Candidatus Baltobacteraceae bacterium]